jgi:hypothetical protein
MFYKIQEAHRLMLQDGGDYDLVIRIRPDRAFRAGTAAPDWAGMAEACRRQRVLFFNHLAVTKTLYAGDQFAVGSPEAMGCYANTLGLQTQAIRENWFGFPKRLRSHCSLAHALLFQGVRRRPLEHIHAVEAVPAAAYGRGELRAMLSADLPAGPASEMDRLLWNALPARRRGDTGASHAGRAGPVDAVGPVPWLAAGRCARAGPGRPRTGPAAGARRRGLPHLEECAPAGADAAPRVQRHPRLLCARRAACALHRRRPQRQRRARHGRGRRAAPGHRAPHLPGQRLSRSAAQPALPAGRDHRHRPAELRCLQPRPSRTSAGSRSRP